jgi:hypothetical protein
VNAPAAAVPLKCPVCAARFRGSAACTRCGTDLTPLMRIAAKAWQARQQARSALRAGDFPRGLRLYAGSRRLHRSGP